MKKQYIIPILELVKVRSQQILSGSFNGNLNPTGTSGNNALAPEFDWYED